MSLLQRAVILDSELLGLKRGSGLHQYAVHDLETNHTVEWLVDPHMVVVDSPVQQDLTRLASSPVDLHYLRRFHTWPDAVRAQVLMEYGTTGSWDQILDRVKKTNPMLWDALSNQSFLMGHVPTAADQLARQVAIGGILTTHLGVDIEALLGRGGEMERMLAGRTVWAANIPFESSQMGARVGAMEQAGLPTLREGLRLETQTRSPNLLYVTGQAVNQARAHASMTGNWQDVWKAYLAHPPKPGETAVRDIQDLTRALGSYGAGMGMLPRGNPYLGTAIEWQYRLLGSTHQDPLTAMQLLTTQQAHQAVEDVAVHEKFVLQRTIHMLETMQHVAEATPQGKQLIEMAEAGHGDFYTAQQYFARLRYLGKDLTTSAAIQRLDRAQRDLLREGVTHQVVGLEGIVGMEQTTPSGTSEIIPRVAPARASFRSMGEVVDFLESEGKYTDFGVQIRSVWDRMSGVLGPKPTEEGLTQYLEQNTKASIRNKIRTEARQIMEVAPNVGDLFRTSAVLDGLVGGLSSIKAHHVIGGGLAAMAGIAGLGMIWSAREQQINRPQNAGLLAVNYDTWRSYQQSGMQEGGVGGTKRKSGTDFGSPYRGPVVSSQVITDQQLLQERERWLRQKYGAVHSTQDDGLFGVFGPFSSLKLSGRPGYRFISDPSIMAADAGQYGMRGNLVSLDLSSGSWKATAEDADTVVVRRGGVRGALQSLMGLNRGFSFRLAGIDAPETSHGAVSFHAPQPHAEESKQAFASMLAQSSNIQLVFDPQQTTYGRMMGAVIADGRNLNYELVRQGQAAYLPYGKRSESIIDYDRLKSMEGLSAQAHQGMWSQPWAMAYFDAMKSAGDRITFNTFTKKEKLVGSATQMSLLSLMEQAQSMGMYGSAQQIAASELGSHIRDEKFKPDYGEPILAGRQPPSTEQFMNEMLRDGGQFMKTHGQGGPQNRFSRKSGYGTLDAYMALDSAGTSNSPWNQPRYSAYDVYDVPETRRKERKMAMSVQQRKVNKTVFNSGINHQMM